MVHRNAQLLEALCAPTASEELVWEASRLRDPAVRELVMSWLCHQPAADARWHSVVAASLRTRSPAVRMAALRAVADHRIGSLVEEVEARLADPNELVRTEALETLEALGAPVPIDLLRNRLETDSSWLVRGYAAHALATLHGGAAIPVLERRLSEERSGWARAQILLDLYRLGRSDALPEALACLGHADHRVRCSVANALGRTTAEADRERVVWELGEALARETTVAAREALTGALGRLASGEVPGHGPGSRCQGWRSGFECEE
jgi:HEAT repeat protein